MPRWLPPSSFCSAVSSLLSCSPRMRSLFDKQYTPFHYPTFSSSTPVPPASSLLLGPPHLRKWPVGPAWSGPVRWNPQGRLSNRRDRLPCTTSAKSINKDNGALINQHLPYRWGNLLISLIVTLLGPQSVAFRMNGQGHRPHVKGDWPTHPFKMFHWLMIMLLPLYGPTYALHS